MSVWAFIVLVIAAVIFFVDYVTTKRLTYLALTILTVGLILAFGVSAGARITL